MTSIVIGQILTLLIMLWGFSIMLRPFFGGAWSAHRGPRGNGGSGCLGRLLSGLIFSVLLPVFWWTIALVGRWYHRTFIVFTEFISGVHDWGTYRTSSFKYGGAFFAFIGFNGALFLLLSLVAVALTGTAPQIKTLLATLAIAVVGCALARVLMRRMP